MLGMKYCYLLPSLINTSKVISHTLTKMASFLAYTVYSWG